MPDRSRLREVAIRTLRRSPPLWRAARAVRRRVNELLPPRRIAGIPGPVHRNDTMLRATGRDRYHDTAVETIDRFVALATDAGVDVASSRWFEIGCGYGRLVRQLVSRVEPGRVAVCDIDPAAARFCQRAFGVRRIASDTSFRFEPPVVVDVSYALSVATHLPPARCDEFVARALETVADGGVLLFTTHGRTSLDQLGAYDDGAYAPMAAAIVAAFDGPDGVAYVPYRFEPDAGYGMTWHRAAAVRDLVERASSGRTVDVSVHEAGIEGHQDLWICRVRG